MNVGKIDRTIMKALDMVEKLEKLFANNGAFENAVMEIDGDISYFGDVRKKLAQLYVDIEDLHMGAVGHNMDESVTESVKLTEGVLDGDDEDGFMARSQLYFLAKDAISLHGMISDRDNLEPWVQSKITKAADYLDSAADYLDSGEHDVEEACWTGYKQVGMKKKGKKIGKKGKKKGEARGMKGKKREEHGRKGQKREEKKEEIRQGSKEREKNNKRKGTKKRRKGKKGRKEISRYERKRRRRGRRQGVSH